VAAILVSNGIDTCQVGYLPEDYTPLAHKLENRIVQVVDIFDESHCKRRRSVAELQDGLCFGVIIDNPNANDHAIDTLCAGYFTDSSSEESKD